MALLAAAAESLTIQDAAIQSGNGEDEDNPAEEGERSEEHKAGPLGPDSIALIFFSPFFGRFFGPFFGLFFGPFFEISYCNSTQSKELMHIFLAN